MNYQLLEKKEDEWKLVEDGDDEDLIKASFQNILSINECKGLKIEQSGKNVVLYIRKDKEAYKKLMAGCKCIFRWENIECIIVITDHNISSSGEMHIYEYHGVSIIEPKGFNRDEAIVIEPYDFILDEIEMEQVAENNMGSSWTNYHPEAINNELLTKSIDEGYFQRMKVSFHRQHINC